MSLSITGVEIDGKTLTIKLSNGETVITDKFKLVPVNGEECILVRRGDEDEAITG